MAKLVGDRPSNPPEPQAHEPLGEKSVDDRSNRLESWKEIASYLKREVRTVQRWEKHEGLPVHRHQHRDRASVFAYKTEIDVWWHNDHARLESRGGEGGGEPGEPETVSAPPGFDQGEAQPPEGTGEKDFDSPSFFARYRWQLWLAGTAVAAVAVAAVAVYFVKFRPSSAPPFHSRGTVLIADFENRTADPVFDGALRQGLAAQLDQSPFLYVVTDQQIGGQLRLMKQAADARMTSGVARQVCVRMGGAAVLEGSIAKVGVRYDLALAAVNCSTGESLARAEAVASDKDHVLGALGAVAASMRRKLGESLASIRRFNKPLDQVTTPSVEALKAFSFGSRALRAGETSAAIASWQQAISEDPNFAMAYARLGSLVSGESLLGIPYLTKAYSLRNRVSERERFYIDSHYITLVTGDLPKAIEVYKLWARTYPQDEIPYGVLGVIYSHLGQYQKAIKAFRHGLEMGPLGALDYENLVLCYIALNRLDKAEAVMGEAGTRKIDPPAFHTLRGGIAWLKGDSTGVARVLAWAADKPPFDAGALFFQSREASFSGQLSRAKNLSDRAVAKARQEGDMDLAAAFQTRTALHEAVAGNAAQARRLASTALRASNGRYSEATAGIALALAGDVTHARRLADDLAKRFSQDTMVQFNLLPTIRAAVALDEHNPRVAITDLQEAIPYELGSPEGDILPLTATYVRGLAFLATHKGPQAAAEFQKILDHPGLAIAEIIVPLAHLGLARARLLSGDRPGARKAYQDFLTLWQHADRGIPALREAKAEYARIR